MPFLPATPFSIWSGSARPSLGPQPSSWTPTKASFVSPQPKSSSTRLEASEVFSTPSHFVVICHGLVQLPAPVPRDRKLRIKLMKACAKSLQHTDGRFVLFSIQSDCVSLYAKTDPSTVLYKLPFAEFDLVKLSQKDRNFFYLTVTSPGDEATSLVEHPTSVSIQPAATPAPDPSTSMCYVFHALNHASADRLFRRLKYFVERYRESNHQLMSTTTTPTTSKQTPLIGQHEHKSDPWSYLNLLDENNPQSVSPQSDQTCSDNVFNVPGTTSFDCDPFEFATPSSLNPFSVQAQSPQSSHQSWPVVSVAPPAPRKSRFIPPQSNPFGPCEFSGSFQSSLPAPRVLTPMTPHSLTNPDKDQNVMQCATSNAKQKSGQQFFDPHFNDFLSDAVKSHFSSGPSSNSNILG